MTAGDGKPCKRCGTSDWYKSGRCKECARVDGRRWQKENPDKVRRYYKRWVENNRDKKLELNRKWQQENPVKYRESIRRWERNNREKTRASVRKWARRNPDKRRAMKQRRRARKAEAGGSFTAHEWQKLCEKYDNRCLACGKRTELTADHVVPVSMGGPSDITNIQPLCQPCNSRKSDRHIDYRTKSRIKRWIQKKLFPGKGHDQ